MPGVAVHASLRRAALAFVVVSALAQAIDPDAGHARPLLEGDFTNPSWSPAGNELAVLHAGVLEVANADGTGLHELLVPPTGGETHPAWSPDGTQLVGTLGDGDDVDIANVKTRALRQIYHDDGIGQVSLSDPANADGSNQRRLTHSPGPDVQPDWQPRH